MHDFLGFENNLLVSNNITEERQSEIENEVLDEMREAREHFRESISNLSKEENVNKQTNKESSL
jgi:hypothetical protein